MKKTVYFTGQQQNSTELDRAITLAVEKRDEFLADLSNNVAKIDSEDIKIVVLNNSVVNAVIQLTYFPKNNDS
jgi:hypothetical protein